MNGLEVWCAKITHIKEHQPQWIAITAVVTGHFYVWRHDHCLTSFHHDWLAALHFQCECAFQDVNSHRKTVSMEHCLVARFEARCENAHLLLLALGHPLDDLAQE